MLVPRAVARMMRRRGRVLRMPVDRRATGIRSLHVPGSDGEAKEQRHDRRHAHPSDAEPGRSAPESRKQGNSQSRPTSPSRRTNATERIDLSPFRSARKRQSRHDLPRDETQGAGGATFRFAVERRHSTGRQASDPIRWSTPASASSACAGAGRRWRRWCLRRARC